MLASRPPTTQMILHVSLKMAQLTSMAVPPLYLISSLVLRRGRPFSVNQLMRVSIGSVLLASGVGAAMGWGRLRNEPSGAIVDRVERMVRLVSSCFEVTKGSHQAENRKSMPVK